MTRSRYWRQQEIQQANPAKYRCPCCFNPVVESGLCEICKGLSAASKPDEVPAEITARILGRV